MSERAHQFCGGLSDSWLQGPKPYFRHIDGLWAVVGRGGFATGPTWRDALTTWERASASRRGSFVTGGKSTLPPEPISPVRGYHAERDIIMKMRHDTQMAQIKADHQRAQSASMQNMAGIQASLGMMGLAGLQNMASNSALAAAKPYVEVKPVAPKKGYRTGEDLYAELFDDGEWMRLPPKVRGMYETWAAA